MCCFRDIGHWLLLFMDIFAKFYSCIHKMSLIHLIKNNYVSPTNPLCVSSLQLALVGGGVQSK